MVAPHPRSASPARRPWRLFRRDRRGTYVLEFAFVFNALLILLLLTLEVAFQMAISVALDHGARQASRQAALGTAVSDPVPDTATLLNNVLTRTGLPLQAWAATTTTISAETFADYAALASAAALPSGYSCPNVNTGVGTSGSIMRYCIIYTSRIFTPYARLMLPNSVAVHRTFFVLQNEPY